MTVFFFVVDVKRSITGCAYTLLEMMIFFVIPKLEHFILWSMLGVVLQAVHTDYLR